MICSRARPRNFAHAAHENSIRLYRPDVGAICSALAIEADHSRRRIPNGDAIRDRQKGHSFEPRVVGAGAVPAEARSLFEIRKVNLSEAILDAEQQRLSVFS